MSSLPTFAIIGHPNEGKSSIIATLAQNDSIAISATPGETVRLQRFDLKAGRETIIEFVDTPGFQNPQATLAWFRDHDMLGEKRVAAFINAHKDQPDFDHDCELLRPLIEGAGIMYVADASRPLTSVDLAEMEILRLTARPRMAIINPKSTETRFLDHWKSAFRQHFNAVRTFNAQQACYVDRLDLLEALKSIDQDWEPALSRAITLLQQDRQQAIALTVDAIVDHLEQSLTCRCTSYLDKENGVELEKQKLEEKYRKKLERIEQRFRDQVRDIFVVRRTEFSLPQNSILREQLFSERAWQALGLTQRQLAVVGAVLGAGLGAGAEMAVGGLSLGLFTTLGAALGAGSALWKGKDLARAKIKQLPLGGLKVTVGPNVSDQFPFVQLDRYLLFARFTMNWAHARQETQVKLDALPEKIGVSSQWSQADLKLVAQFVNAVRKGSAEALERASQDVKQLLHRALTSPGDR